MNPRRITEENRLEFRPTTRISVELMQLAVDAEPVSQGATLDTVYKKDDFEIRGITCGMLERWAQELRDHELKLLDVTKADMDESRHG